MTDCQWMFGDAATGLLGFYELSGLNPLRWSGSLTFEKAVADLRQVEKHKDRPIIVKAPSGFLSEEKRFATCQLAIDFLEQSDPTKAIAMNAEAASFEAQKDVEDAQRQVADALEQNKAEAERSLQAKMADRQRALDQAVNDAEAYLAEKQKFAKDAQEQNDLATKQVKEAKNRQITSDVKANWMFGDAGPKLFGFAWARTNPIRWSGVQSFDKTVADMKQTAAKEIRPIAMIAPADGKEKQYANQQEAIDYLYNLCPEHKENKEQIVLAETSQTQADARLATSKWCVTESERLVAKAKHALDPDAPIALVARELG